MINNSKRTLLASSLLTITLLVTGCSNNDSADTAAVENANGPVEETVAANTDNIEDTAIDNSMATENTSNDTSLPNIDSDTSTLAATQPSQDSLVTNPTEPGTPEDTVKQALNTLYYGDVKDAVGYYQVDMANFETELANTQSAFQQTVESVTFTNTQYSVDNTKAVITGELRLKGQSEPAPLTYQLRKVNGQWKILG